MIATASEIADIIKITDRAVRKRAKLWQPIDDSYPARYDIATLALPKADAKRLKVHFTRKKSQANPAPAETGECPLEETDHSHLWSYYDSKPDKAKQEAQRKLQALHSALALIQSGQPKMTAYTEVAEQNGEHWQTICRWFARVKDLPREHWLPALLDGYTGRMKTADCSAEAWDSFKADFLRRAQPTEKACYDRLTRAAKVKGWTVPSLKTLLRKLKSEMSREAIILARKGEDGLKLCYPDQERDHGVFHALEAVNGDGYTFWPHVDFGDGVILRPTAWVWQDIYSSRILAHRTDVSENTDTIRLSIGDMIEKYGIPKKFWIDNTRAAANKTVTGGLPNRYRFKVKDEDPIGLIPMLGAEGHWATPGHGQAKPVERCFGIGGMSEYVDKHPAWEGRGTKKKPVPLAEFESVLCDEIAAWNARLGRRGRGMNGRSCDMLFFDSYEKSVIRKATPEQRRLWLTACENVTCHRDDASITIKFYNGPQGQNRYWNEALSPYASRKITVRFDPANLSAGVHCYALDGRYICFSQCLIAAGFNDSDAAREHAKLRNQHKKGVKQQLHRERRMTALESARNLPATEAPATPVTKIVGAVFGKQKKTVGSDIEHHDSFARAVQMMKEAESRKIRL